MHPVKMAQRPSVTNALLEAIFPATSPVLSVLELGYQGAVQTPIKDLAGRLNFVEQMALHVGLTIARLSDDSELPVWQQVVERHRDVSWGAGKKYETFQAFVQDTLGQDRGLYPILHDINNLAFPILRRDTDICHLPRDLGVTYRKMNPYQGRPLEARLEGVPQQTLDVLRTKILTTPTNFEDHLGWLPSTCDLPSTRRGRDRTVRRLAGAYREHYGTLLRQYPREYDTRLGLDSVLAPRRSPTPTHSDVRL